MYYLNIYTHIYLKHFNIHTYVHTYILKCFVSLAILSLKRHMCMCTYTHTYTYTYLNLSEENAGKRGNMEGKSLQVRYP